jgi:DNA polymerase III subunit gamma/tau
MAEDVPFVSLYRRFRPGRFEELKGQDHVVRALQSAVRDDRVSHAYLFSGPRGTGKTSSARILAKALNCLQSTDGEPCGVCTSCVEIARGTSLDVHELDAASNNGVDAMRDLVAHAALGTPGRWKVYIVDEVHMLSNAAANSLLKTLEEPPSHVVFVLATTEPQKVPATIRSRTQHLEFRLLGADTLQTLLESVRTQGGLEVDDTSLQAAVRRGHGSARDALSALDQVVASGANEVGRPEVESVVSAMAEGEAADVLLGLSALFADGWGPQQLATELVDDLRQAFLAALAPDLCAVSGPERSVFTSLAESMGLARVVRGMEILGQALIDMRDAPDAQVVLEIATVRTARADLDQGTAALTERVSALERALAAGAHSAHPPASVVEVRPEATNPKVSRPETRSEPKPEVTRRPSVGAVQRSRTEAAPPAATTPAATTPAATTPAATAPTPPNPTTTAPANADTQSVAVPAGPTAGATGAPTSAPTSNGRGKVDRDTVTQAWGDGVLHGLSARAKALYSAGRFVAVDEKGAQFALPNAAHRDRCRELASDVEAALSARFGTPIRLVLVIEGDGGEPPSTPIPVSPDAGNGPTSRGEPEAELDEEDPEVLLTVPTVDDHQSAAVDRLLQAFPGASEIVE